MGYIDKSCLECDHMAITYCVGCGAALCQQHAWMVHPSTEFPGLKLPLALCKDEFFRHWHDHLLVYGPSSTPWRHAMLTRAGESLKGT